MSDRKYEASEKARARRRRYDQSDKGRARTLRQADTRMHLKIGGMYVGG